jgi:hypothetical protein
MSKSSGRRLLRSPFPLDQSPQISGSSFHKRQPSPSGDNLTLADVETRKNPALTPNRSPNSALADVETRENPAIVPHPSQDKGLFSAAMAQYAVAQKSPPSSSSPSYTRNTNSTQTKEKRVRLSKQKKMRLAAVAIMLLIPCFIIIFELINAIIIYRQMQDGINHLQAAANVFHGNSSGGIANYLDTRKLHQAREEIDIAHDDFASLSDKLEHDGAISLSSYLLPTQINTVRALGGIAADGTAVAQQLLKTMGDIAPSVAPAFQKSSSSTGNALLKSYLTPSSYQAINNTLDDISPLIHRMALYAQGLSLNALPISSKQRKMIASILPLLPALDAVLSQRGELRNPLGWFLGIGGQRNFLVEPMDSAELRATGGFTGQFGELVLNGAHVGPLKLSNIGKYEEDHSSEGSPPDATIYPKVVGQSAPAPYSQWWPIGNFGLRDANLSADFPTSARIAMDRYSYEFGKNVDGVIIFTPALIKQVLHVTGPISIPVYKQTITEQNLEDLLHYYQLNNTGIRREEIVEHVNDNQIARKLFTQRVTAALINTVTHLPLDKMFSLANELLHSMKSKDLQIYVTNSQLESLIGKYGSTASLDRSPTHDGFFIVQSNLSASKASQYVTTTIQDTITLNNHGGATHYLQLTLDYKQKGDVYGLDTYRDYVRIYVPVNSQLLTGNGFDQFGKPYCGDEQSGYSLCQPDVYGDGSLVCSPPIEIGYASSYLGDPYAGKDHPLDVTGPPQNQQSDEAGRAMFGGWVVIPKNCTMKVTLSWYVPPMSKQPYSLLLQAQASVYSPLDLTIQPPAGTCAFDQGNALHFSRVMDGEDIFFTVKRQGSKCSLLSQ